MAARVPTQSPAAWTADPGRPGDRGSRHAGRRARTAGAALAALSLLAVILPGAALAEGSGGISGTVFDVTGAPSANVFVFACSGTCSHVKSAADGTYSIVGLASGSYRVGIEDVSGKLPGGYATATSLTPNAAAAASVTVAVAAVAFDIHVPAGQHISGTITAAAGGSLGNVLVQACASTLAMIDQGFAACGAAVTGSDGAYSLAVLPSTYQLAAFDMAHTHAIGYYATTGYVFSARLATPIAVGALDVAGINLALPAGAAIAGTVDNAGGAAVAGIDVTACLAADPSGCGFATTAVDGSYSIDGLPAGSYKVIFTDANAEYPTGFYSPVGFIGDWGAAQAVVLGATGATGIDVKLPAGHIVSGVVTDAAGRPARVQVDDCTSSLCVPVSTTGADGSYRINVATGRHSFHVSDFSGANLSGYYSTAGLANSLHATGVTVGSSDMAGVSIRLRRTGAGIHAGIAHTGAFVANTAVTKGTYATVRFTLGKPFAGTRVTVMRASKSGSGTWSTYRAVATVVVGADGNAFYSARISGSIAFRARESDNLVRGVVVLSAPVYVHSR